jgi:hypothetical protein
VGSSASNLSGQLGRTYSADQVSTDGTAFRKHPKASDFQKLSTDGGKTFHKVPTDAGARSGLRVEVTEKTPDAPAFCDPLKASLSRSLSGFGFTPVQAKPSDAAEIKEDLPDVSRIRLAVMAIAWLFCATTWLIGVSLPSLELDVFIGTPMQHTIIKSLTQSLQTLFEHRMWTSFILLTSFSVIIPILKIVCTLVIILALTRKPLKTVFASHSAMIWTLSYLASYQFVDLYAGIIFAAFFDSDSSNSRFCRGFYYFSVYCLASCSLSSFLENTFSPTIADLDAAKQAAKQGNKQELAESPELQSLKHNTDFRSPTGDKLFNELTDPLKTPRMVAKRDNTREFVDLEEPNIFSPSRGSSFRWQALAASVTGRKDVEGDGNQQRVDMKSVYFFSFCYLFLMAVSAPETFLELRLLFKGVTADRNALSPWEIIVDMLPRMVHPVMLGFLWFFSRRCPCTVCHYPCHAHHLARCSCWCPCNFACGIALFPTMGHDGCVWHRMLHLSLYSPGCLYHYDATRWLFCVLSVLRRLILLVLLALVR